MSLLNFISTILIPTSDRPLGLLNPIHKFILNHAQPITLSNLIHVGLIPILPLVFQSYLMHLDAVQEEIIDPSEDEKRKSQRRRGMRIGLGVLGVGLVIRAWTGYRFTQPDLNALNVGLSLTFLHSIIKYFELALNSRPYIDAYLSRGRPVWRSVLDLCINARMIGLGVNGDKSIGSAESLNQNLNCKPNQIASSESQTPSSTSSLLDSNKDIEGVTIPYYGSTKLPINPSTSSTPKIHEPNLQHESYQTSKSTIPNLDSDELPPIKLGRHLPSLPKTRRTRLQAITRHLYKGITNLWILDTLLAVQKLLGPDTLGNPNGVPGALHTFSHSHSIALLPHIPFLSFILPPWAVEMGIVAGLASGLSAGVSGVYHLFGAGALVLGWEVESWEVDMMDKPLMGTSLLDVWGRRWHQLFRHQLILLTTTTLSLFNQSSSSPIFPPTLFLYSALYHILGVISCNPVPPIIPLSGFFLISGVGGALEIAFKRITGKKVRGWPGRLWVWLFLLCTGRWVVGSWIDSGLAGSKLGLPGPGRWVAKWITEYIFKVVR